MIVDSISDKKSNPSADNHQPSTKMNILDKIIVLEKEEIASQKSKISVEELKNSGIFEENFFFERICKIETELLLNSKTIAFKRNYQ